MAVVAQVVEPRGGNAVVAGSSPISRPIFYSVPPSLLNSKILKSHCLPLRAFFRACLFYINAYFLSYDDMRTSLLF